MGKYKIFFGMIAGALITVTPVAAQDPDSLEVQRQEHNQQAGTENLETLALLLHQALQTNNPELLRRHLVDKRVYDKLMQLGTAPVRESLLLYSPTDLQLDFQQDFGQVMQDGATLEVDWPTTSIKETIVADTPPTRNAVIFPAQLHLNSSSGLPFQVHFTTARLDGRYYLLPPLRLSEEL
ncbi:hypothetical protein A3841_08215 [Pontibacter flavimaris]|uniref:DUF3887 domain-containing protein n=2 Tax=Pontibacter flavimaris TaxID=1797110 RepID=A0A1Q5PIC8_9BACT|nr:hypothetical protein A3841_08215 [Pontibacter flavimaris]